MAPLSRALLLVSLGAYACDQALVDESYRGEPLSSLQVDVLGQLHAAHPRAAVFWAKGLEGIAAVDLEEQVSTSQKLEAGRSYRLNLFESPPRSLPWSAKEPEGPVFSLGRIRAYDDSNDNGRFDADETLIGGVFPLAVLWSAQDLPARVGPTSRSVAKGLHTVLLPLPCDWAARPVVPESSACELPFGERCRRDEECGSGRCVSASSGLPWPGNACLAPLRGCRPADSESLPGAPDETFWAPACTTDADCAREGPYGCDVALGVCAPVANVVLTIVDDAPTVDFCPPHAPKASR